MAHAIPKIEYKNETQTATTTSASDTLTSVASTTTIEVGMLAEGTGIPTGTTVLAKTSNTVQLSAVATASATVSVSFLYRISFDYPPIEEGGEVLEPQDRSTVSLSGETQTSVDFVEGRRTLKFSFLSQSIYESLKTFHITHAYIGRTFRYYDDKTTGTYTTYELVDLKFDPKKITSRGTDYVWLVPYKFRRVVI